MNIIIKETGQKETLELTIPGVGINCVQDFIGNRGDLDNGTFTWSDEHDAYMVKQDDYEWWAHTIELHQMLEDKAHNLTEQYGYDTVMSAIIGVAETDLDSEALAIMEALDAAFPIMEEVY